MCVCKRAADKGLVTGATPAPPCKTCSQQNIKNRTTQVHGTTINPAAFSLRMLGLLSPVFTQAEWTTCIFVPGFFWVFLPYYYYYHCHTCRNHQRYITLPGGGGTREQQEWQRGVGQTIMSSSPSTSTSAARPAAKHTKQGSVTADVPTRSHEKIKVWGEKSPATRSLDVICMWNYHQCGTGGRCV